MTWIISTTTSAAKSDTPHIDFARNAAAKGAADRFQPYALSAGDVIEYLPVARFVPKAASWEALRAEFDAQKKHASFKPFLASRYGAEFTFDGMREATGSMDEVPDELLSLLELCRRLSSTSRLRPTGELGEDAVQRGVRRS